MKIKTKALCGIFSLSALTCAAQTATPGDSLRMDSIIHNLPEVMVKGERPMVKVKGSALVYDIKRITEKKPVDNAYDALKELPGVVEMNGQLTLGGQGATVILDGQVTNLTKEQLTQVLKSVPKDRLADVEIMYNAPAKYNVRGACININFLHETAQEQRLTGEVFGVYDQSHDAAFQERASLVYAGKKMSIDFMYSHDHGNSYKTTETDSHHSLSDGNVYDISTYQRSGTRGHNHQMRLSMGYNFAESHNLNVTYYGSYAPGHTKQETTGSINSKYGIDTDPWTHDIAADYKMPFGTNIGAEYTFYKAPQTQTQNSVLTDGSLDYISNSRQELNIWKVYVKQDHTLKNGWGLNYGATYSTSSDNSYQNYLSTVNRPQDLPDNISASKRENIVNIYAGFNKNFNNKLIIDASLAAEYYNNPSWNEWNWLPTVNATWIPSQGHILQFGFSSYSTYPEYWAVQNFTSYNNGGYGVIVGNPELKPMREYSAQLTYVLKNKYVFRGWFTHTDDLFMQTLYQQPDELRETFKVMNFDFQQQAGLMAAVPLKLGKWYSANLTALGVWLRQKDSDFYDIPFDRNIVYGMFTLRNDFHISSQPEITLSVNGMVRTKALQADYDLPASGNVDAALQIKFLKNKRATLKLYCADIFETAQIDPYINFKGQRLDMDMSSYRHFGVSFSYAFGNYKEKQHKKVDTSRFLK